MELSREEIVGTTLILIWVFMSFNFYLDCRLVECLYKLWVKSFCPLIWMTFDESANFADIDLGQPS